MGRLMPWTRVERPFLRPNPSAKGRRPLGPTKNAPLKLTMLAFCEKSRPEGEIVMKLMLVSYAVVGILAVAGAVRAQVTQSYSYDGNGRLIGVTTTSGGGGTNTAAYAYDAAHNRTQRVRSGVTTYAAIPSLSDGGLLSPFEALVSPDGRFTFALRQTGRLELWREDHPVWTLDDLVGAPSFAMTEAGARLALGREPASEAPVWSVTNDGALIVTAGAADTALWSSTAGIN